MADINDIYLSYIRTMDNYFNRIHTDIISMNSTMERYLQYSESLLYHRRHENNIVNGREANDTPEYGEFTEEDPLLTPVTTRRFVRPNRTRNTARSRNRIRSRMRNRQGPRNYSYTPFNLPSIINPSNLNDRIWTRHTRQSPLNIPNFINNTLLNLQPRNTPASIEDISNNTSILNFIDISMNASQLSCPITQELFDNSSVIMRINRCGHIFNRSSLSHWFTLNNRCPICRYNISTNSYCPTREEINNTSNTSTQTSFIQPIDISFSFPTGFQFPINDNSNNNVNNVNNMDNMINNVANTIMTGVTNALNNTDINSMFDLSFNNTQ